MKKIILISSIIIFIVLLAIIIFNIINRKKENKVINTIDNIEKQEILNQTSEKLPEEIEKIPENAKSFIELLENNEIILNNEEIKKYNEDIEKKTDTIYDLDNINSLTKEEILSYIDKYKLPNLPQYDGNKTITKEDTKNILENRNISEIKNLETIQKGIIIKRANLRSFPTNINFYNQKYKQDFDNLQESELHVNTEILIIHESKDKQWNFIISPIYAGWVNKENLALATDEDINFFIKNNSFGIITQTSIEIENTILDMSVSLPYIDETEEKYKFILPQKGNDGYIIKTQIEIEKDKSHIGYLPYTKRNVYIQAFKYEGVDYSWGGKDKGVDCSSYIANIYRCFGFMFPRNTSSQNKSVGQIIFLNDKTPKQKLEIIEKEPLSLLYRDGHVMLYLGKIDNKNYIIHASGDKMKVVLEELTENSNNLKQINKLITISNY